MRSYEHDCLPSMVRGNGFPAFELRSEEKYFSGMESRGRRWAVPDHGLFCVALRLHMTCRALEHKDHVDYDFVYSF